jgi:hypothetical protein
LIDEAMGLCTFRRAGQVLWRARAEALAAHSPDIGLLRWWFSWAASNTRDRHRLSAGWREAQRMGLRTLLDETVSVDEDEVEPLIGLFAQLAGAEGTIARAAADGEQTYFALFQPQPTDLPLDERASRSAPPPPMGIDLSRGLDLVGDDVQVHAHAFSPAKVGAARFSVTPPTSSAARASSRPTMGVRNLAPVDLSEPLMDLRAPALPRSLGVPGISSESHLGRDLRDAHEVPRSPIPKAPATPPPAALPIREPSREVLMPLVQPALGTIAAALPGFRQALVVLTVDVDGGKGRFSLQLVGADAAGDLQVIDPPSALLEASAKLIGDDARSGNGRWRRLIVRLSSTARGASVSVTVV